ncbi:MAG: glycosyl hydrolase 115 family protein [Clostridia bacterium]|nr:glycosyl hydrolase 115 family protein [Clostridia bacterium]
MYILFDRTSTARLCLAQNAPDCVRLAAEDLRRNLLDLSGKTAGFDLVTASVGDAITIVTDPASAPAHIEGYAVTVRENGVRITGADALGTVYGIYAFATKCLGIDPLYQFTDIFPETRECMALSDMEITSAENPTRYRGWFINDEDFLSGFAPSGAKRAITYNKDFFKEVLSVSMMDRIFESALRLGMNTIIPCSFIDILNPAEEAIVEQAVARGLYVSQHHQEPAGVAYFAAENYMLAHHPGKAVSFIQSPAEMEEIWRTYIQKWAKYGQNVIWQLGLRGKGDKAVWYSDGSVGDDGAARGEIISRAIATQHRIIAETLGHSDFVSTSTLWLEGAELYDKGYLQMPESTIVVFSDIGDTQLFGADFYRVQRREGCSYGVYYHAGFFVEGPHYTDGTDPRKMVYCYRDAEKYCSLDFSILNVANVREMCSSIRLNAAILAGKPSEFDLDAYYQTVYPTLYGDAGREVAELEKRYFDAIGDAGNEIGQEMIDFTDFHYYSLPDLPFPYYPLTDGAIMRMGCGILGFWRRECGTWKVYVENEKHFKFVYGVYRQCTEDFAALLPRVAKTEQRIPTNALAHYRLAIRHKIELMLRLCQWALCACEIAMGKDAKANKERGIAALREIMELREEFNRGKWQGWYDCDRRLDIPKRIGELESYEIKE